ncbi:smoothelin-like protein 2 [Brienomyrus brachyistius]|uniref:smoothelin-like protein 2 n=1 Tax=Brienomyrus brachyistius TaxID=42636 RepID=UPI0020B24F03|nr:smoothelin-like protein 2 [Brienomyrus brachyistius]XP_048840456.1 smoothelin-like protein 2 [Brienomyrus brachyistius]XP_048840457.1 smoothelin-like protein 2 [Brienomyrus brachyistius]
MDSGQMTAVGESPLEGETVCAALARYEATLQAAVRELHADVGAFKVGVERRLEEADRLTGPLGRAVAQLQLENRQLRGQLEALTRRVEEFTGTVCDRSALQESSAGVEGPPQPVGHRSPASPSAVTPPCADSAPSPGSGPAHGPTATRFSSRATFAVFNKSNSIEKEEPIEVDPVQTNPVLENGHQVTPEKPVRSQELRSPANDGPQEHPAPVARSRPHLPKTSDPPVSSVTKNQEPLSSPGRVPPPFPTEPQLSSQLASSDPLRQPVPQSQVPAVKSWTPGTMKTMVSPLVTDRASSMPPKSVTHCPVTPPSAERETFSGGGMESRRDLVRSQTLPRSAGAQARRAMFERLDSDPNRPKPLDSKPKLKRSQSFGVSSASSIKQILLEWCRSKTIGYQNIDIQNFSSSWSDGLAFCALVHSFFPTEFDYNTLTPTDCKHNFEVAFSTAEAKAGCDRLIEVEDMMVMGRKPDPMCVFTYVQSLYNHLRRFE